ncbi:Fimbriae usher protein StcC (plasmid) [Klebsiella aerogenes]|nr:Fimbriae usher protein StcC [Klebsiella aerogenes]
MQASYQYGLNNLLTLYGGTMLGTDYQLLLWEPGGNTHLGAVSVDGTWARSDQDNGTFEGQSYQIAYNKLPHPD